MIRSVVSWRTRFAVFLLFDVRSCVIVLLFVYGMGICTELIPASKHADEFAAVAEDENEFFYWRSGVSFVCCRWCLYVCPFWRNAPPLFLPNILFALRSGHACLSLLFLISSPFQEQ